MPKITAVHDVRVQTDCTNRDTGMGGKIPIPRFAQFAAPTPKFNIQSPLLITSSKLERTIMFLLVKGHTFEKIGVELVLKV